MSAAKKVAKLAFRDSRGARVRPMPPEPLLSDELRALAESLDAADVVVPRTLISGAKLATYARWAERLEARLAEAVKVAELRRQAIARRMDLAVDLGGAK